MIITVASGKGGTGKTSVAVNLAAAVSKASENGQSRSVWLADCDVEAPNDALFMAPRIEAKAASQMDDPRDQAWTYATCADAAPRFAL